MPSPWARRLTGRPVTCTGCAECDPAIAEADRKADEAFWAEEDARWNRQREAEEKADAAFWVEQARLTVDPGTDADPEPYVDSTWRERPQF